jgi:hypothetical protein
MAAIIRKLTAAARTIVSQAVGTKAERLLLAALASTVLSPWSRSRLSGSRAVLDELARLQADLRYTHLSAHLAMRSVLSAEQISRYDALRGYSDGSVAPAGQHRMQH